MKLTFLKNNNKKFSDKGGKGTYNLAGARFLLGTLLNHTFRFHVSGKRRRKNGSQRERKREREGMRESLYGADLNVLIYIWKVRSE